jgi:endonuclease/exonuclease/phosphatase family metal-dependent hydrolase
VALDAVVDSPAGRLRVVTTHLSFLPFSNGRQLRRLLGALRPAAGPTVLLGDLNMGPRRARRLTGLHPLAEGATFPAHRPTVQLDHLMADRPLPTSYAGPVALEMSDHRALVADLLPAY